MSEKDEKNKKPPKLTPTTRHLLTATPDEIVEMPPPLPGEIPNGRLPIPRLGMRIGQPMEYTPEMLAKDILGSPQDAVFFCDANMFIGKTHDSIWQALLQRRVAIVPPVLQELDSWSKNPKHNLLAHSAFQRMLAHDPTSPFEVYQFDGDDPNVRRLFEYYVNLLSLRKRLIPIVTDQLATRLGRQPTPSEVESFIKKELGERAFQRAKKGAEADGSPNFHSDEYLVVTAVVHAIAFGTEAMLLTRDADIQEQFYKLFWFLDTHYRAMLFADAYIRDPHSWVSLPLPKHHERIREAFVGADDLLIEGRKGFLDDVLPAEYHPICAYCALLSGPDDNFRLCIDSFCLEQEMGMLLSTKGKTGGLSSTKLDGRNCHIWLAPLPLPFGHAVIASDQRIDCQTAKIPLLDVQHSFATNERLRRVQVVEE